MTLSHEGLVNYYKLNFTLMQNHKYSLTEIEDMVPWERDIYVTLLIDHLKNENQKIQQKNLKRQE